MKVIPKAKARAKMEKLKAMIDGLNLAWTSLIPLARKYKDEAHKTEPTSSGKKLTTNSGKMNNKIATPIKAPPTRIEVSNSRRRAKSGMSINKAASSKMKMPMTMPINELKLGIQQQIANTKPNTRRSAPSIICSHFQRVKIDFIL